MENITKILFFSFVFVFLVSCSKVLYPISNKLKVEKAENVKYQSLYERENFFQLRIKRTIDFLPVNTDSNINQELISDFPIKRFQQQKSPQKIDSDNDTLTVEETYLYLDRINLNKSKKSNENFGYAYYFITYPIIDRNPNEPNSRTKKYFNNPDTLFTNITRSIQVGYWVKNNNDLLLIFQNSKDNIAVYMGSHCENKVSVNKISHPSKLNKKIKNLAIFDFIKELIVCRLLGQDCLIVRLINYLKILNPMLHL